MHLQWQVIEKEIHGIMDWLGINQMAIVQDEDQADAVSCSPRDI